jgi:hypothetical protein
MLEHYEEGIHKRNNAKEVEKDIQIPRNVMRENILSDSEDKLTEISSRLHYRIVPAPLATGRLKVQSLAQNL